MGDQLIDGKAIARNVRRKISEEIKELSIKPGLAVVLVGENPGSQVYVRMNIVLVVSQRRNGDSELLE